MSNLSIRSELDYVSTGVSLCMDSAPANDGMKQHSPFFASIPYTDNGISQLEKAIQSLSERFGDLHEYGKNRTDKAYLSINGGATKPSYSGRIFGTDKNSELDQWSQILEIYRKEPSSGGLSFSVFLPGDLQRRQRPGYVPCLIAGSFVLEHGALSLNAFFRSQSILEFGLFDILHLRKMQSKMLIDMRSIRPDLDSVSIGNLNLMAARIFIPRRVRRIGNRDFLKRDEAVSKFIKSIFIT